MRLSEAEAARLLGVRQRYLNYMQRYVPRPRSGYSEAQIRVFCVERLLAAHGCRRRERFATARAIVRESYRHRATVPLYCAYGGGQVCVTPDAAKAVAWCVAAQYSVSCLEIGEGLARLGHSHTATAAA